MNNGAASWQADKGLHDHEEVVVEGVSAISIHRPAACGLVHKVVDCGVGGLRDALARQCGKSFN